MSTKDKILKILEENRDSHISGESIATELGISRTAVWKAVKSLKSEGHNIDSVTNKGYKLDVLSDKLDKWAIVNNLRPELKDIDIRVYESIDSTNTEAKRILNSENLSNFTILVSDEQTSGRGRHGKSFKSPKGTGVYFSIIFFPTQNFSYNSFDLVTIKVAVSIINAIKNKTDKNPEIKWVNDIFLNHKKICGILTEADTDFESKKVRSIITGIGINFTTEFTDELSPIAGSLSAHDLRRSELVAEIINQFYESIYFQSDADVLQAYKAHSLLLGRSVNFELNGTKYEAIAKDINENGNLIVETTDGQILTLSSGEVSVKGQF